MLDGHSVQWNFLNAQIPYAINAQIMVIMPVYPVYFVWADLFLIASLRKF